jgi:ParB family transcriptional regulator, chromosome partitioning protein
MNNIKELDISRVYPNPGQPRKEFEPGAIKDLANSIKSQGLLQPIVVIPRKNGYMIVSGERRYRAHLLNKSGTIQAIVRNDMVSSTKVEVKIKAVVENVLRQDMTPIEEAKAYKELLQAMTLDELSAAIGIAKFRITWRVRLLNMTTEAQNLFNEGGLTMTQARLLGELDEAKQTRLLSMIRAGRCSTDAKLKSAKQLLMATEVYEQNGLGLEVASDQESLTLRNSINQVAFELAQLTARVQQKNTRMSVDLAHDAQNTLDNLIKTAKMLQKELQRQEIMCEAIA